MSQRIADAWVANDGNGEEVKLKTQTDFSIPYSPVADYVSISKDSILCPQFWTILETGSNNCQVDKGRGVCEISCSKCIFANPSDDGTISPPVGDIVGVALAFWLCKI